MEGEVELGHRKEEAFSSRLFDFLSKGKGISDDATVHRHNWDACNWQWDSNLFVATPSPPMPPLHVERVSVSDIPATNDTSSFAGGVTYRGNNNDSLPDKRRRVFVAEESGMDYGEASLTLKLGDGSYQCSNGTVEAGCSGSNGKRHRTQGLSSQNRSVCQVDDCKADLSNAKDYHRRHRVCEIHAKSNNAVVGCILQRFCQQCSRFHLLEEFDEEKRSCRRRLTSHNRRRRKAYPGHFLGAAYLRDEQISGSLLLILLKLLAQLQNSSCSEQASGHEILLEFLKKLASCNDIVDAKNALVGRQLAAQKVDNGIAVTHAVENVSQVPKDKASVKSVATNETNSSSVSRIQERQNSQPFHQTHTSLHSSINMPDNSSVACEVLENLTNHSRDLRQKDQGIHKWSESREFISDCLQDKALEKERFSLANNFDLNNSNDGSQDAVLEADEPSTLLLLGGPQNVSMPVASGCYSSLQNIYQAPPASDNSESGSDHSPSSSQGDGQDRTGRIVFKLFGKNPSEIPQSLRLQILDWLAHSPSDIESHIRPGCIILTLYLRLSESQWMELVRGFRCSLENLLKVTDIDFWKKGWIFAQIEQRVAFIFNGQVLLDMFSSIEDAPMIFCVTPVAVSVGKKANIMAKGFNLSSTNSKIFCAFQGNYIVHESTTEGECTDGSKNLKMHGSEMKRSPECQHFSFLPQKIGRGFVEVEGNDMRGNFFPLIVADEDTCAELCTLEKYIDFSWETDEDSRGHDYDTQLKQRLEAIEFLHELGWLFQRSCLSSSSFQFFSAKRFMWLLRFAVEKDWCMVVKQLLNILFSRKVDSDLPPMTMLEEVGILHIAVKQNCRAMVELLLGYVPKHVLDETGGKSDCERSNEKVFLRPDMPGAAGITPLHVAASIDNAESVLDALTNDPGQIGLKAWSAVRDHAGMTSEGYALLAGRQTYIELIQKKLEKTKDEHFTIEIPEQLCPAESGRSELFNKSINKENKRRSNKVEMELPQKTNWPSHKHKTGVMEASLYSCRVCEQQRLCRYRSNTLLYRPALLSMLAIATVCVCVTLLLKGPPEVLYVVGPFRWEMVKFGPK